MTNLSPICEQAFERGIEHANQDDLAMTALKLGYAFKLAVTAGVTMDKEQADVLYARLVDAVGYDPGAA